MGNRDNLPPETSLSHRAQGRALNTAENFALFAAIAPVAHVSGSQCYVMTFVRRGGFGDD